MSSAKSKKTYKSCSIEADGRILRLRFRIRLSDGRELHRSRSTGRLDNAENRRALDKVCKLVGAAIKAGHSPDEIDAILEKFTSKRSVAATQVPNTVETGITVKQYFDSWLEQQKPVVRKAQARDYERHIGDYAIPRIGSLTLAELKPAHIRGLQAELLSQPKKKGTGTLSPKYVKNILSGSFQAMIRDALVDDLVNANLFVGLKWPACELPEPDPFSAQEVDKILKWFRQKRWSFHAGRAETGPRSKPHLPFYVYLHVLFYLGLRPSEAAALRWRDIDLDRRTLSIRRSRHMGQEGAPKTRAARRTVVLFPTTVELLKQMQPLHVTPEGHVFTNTNGGPIEPKAFSSRWYDCLRTLNMRQRGVYCTKDTFVTTSLQANVSIPWLENQTGVAYATLRRHYGKWVPLANEDDLKQFERVVPSLFEPAKQKLSRAVDDHPGQFPKSAAIALQKMVRGGGLEPPRVLPH